MRATRLHLAAVIAATLGLSFLPPRPAAAAAPELLDLGRFTLTQDGQPARIEEFSFQSYGDSLVVRAASSPWRENEADLRFDKHMQLVVDARDFELIGYSSQYATRTDTLSRGISLERGDTTFTLWREHNGRGTGDVWARPPGRMYVLDAPLFTLFGYVGWTMQGRTFDRRPVNILVLAGRDTLIEGTVTDAGTEKLVWNGQEVEARKLLVGDERTTVTAWFTGDGHMLRLVEERGGIRAERDAPVAEEPPARKEEPPPGTK